MVAYRAARSSGEMGGRSGNWAKMADAATVGTTNASTMKMTVKRTTSLFMRIPLSVWIGLHSRLRAFYTFHVPARRGLRRRAVQLREKCITSCSKKSRRRRFAWSKPLDGIRPFLDDAPFDQVESDEADQLARPELSNAQHQLFLFVADFDGSQIVIQCRSAPAGKCMKYTWPCQAPLTILL